MTPYMKTIFQQKKIVKFLPKMMIFKYIPLFLDPFLGHFLSQFFFSKYARKEIRTQKFFGRSFCTSLWCQKKKETGALKYKKENETTDRDF